MGKIKECVVLDNSMFDDGSIKCKNFTVSDLDGYYICEWEWIQNKFPNEVNKIKEAINKGKRYITMNVPKGMPFEISWD